MIPSKFKVGNILFCSTLFFILGTLSMFRWDTMATYYLCPLAILICASVYEYRKERHGFTGKSNAQLLYEVRMEQEKITSRLDEIELRTTIGTGD